MNKENVSCVKNDESEVFSTQLLDIGNRKIPVDASTGLTLFPPNFCQFKTSKEELIMKMCPNISINYKNHV